MITIEQALVTVGERIGAWDRDIDNKTLLRIYQVSATQVKELASAEIPAGQRDATETKLRARGVRLGATYRASGVIWAIDQTGCCVWNDTGLKLECTDSELKLSAATIPLAELNAFVSFYDKDDYGYRGVQIELKDGREIVVVDEHDGGAEIDPTYGLMNLQVDGGWISYVGRELSAHFRVLHRDQLYKKNLIDPNQKAEYDAEIEKFERTKHVKPLKLD